MQYLSKSHILNLTTNTLNNTQPSSLCAFMMIRKTHTVYSGKLSLVQNFAEMRPDFRRNFSQFYFRTLLYKSWWPRPTCEPKKNDNERPREGASLCNNGLVFLCVKAFAITKVSRPLPRAKKLAKEFSTADLNRSTTLERLLQVRSLNLVAGFYFFTATI